MTDQPSTWAPRNRYAEQVGRLIWAPEHRRSAGS